MSPKFLRQIFRLTDDTVRSDSLFIVKNHTIFLDFLSPKGPNSESIGDMHHTARVTANLA